MHLNGTGWEAWAKESNKHDPGLQMQCLNANLKIVQSSWQLAHSSACTSDADGDSKVAWKHIAFLQSCAKCNTRLLSYVHFCSTGEEQALCDTEQHAACFNYYLEKNIFLIL